MQDYKNVLIFGELDGACISSMTSQLLRIGKTLSEQLNQELHVIFLEGKPTETITAAYGHGADKVYRASDALLENYMTDSHLQVLEQAAKDLKPAIILFGQNQKGLDLAPRLAFRLKTGVTLDCVDLNIDPETGLLEQVKPVFGGKAHGHYVSAIDGQQIAAVREGAFDPTEHDASKTGDIIEFKIEMDVARIRTRFVRKEQDPSLELALQLTAASVVVSGGRGLKKQEGVELLKETAKLLGGAVAASRPAIDQGWFPNSLQVGLTGKKVNPQVYIAVGISGALQHMAGCSNAKVIVAINTDEAAPIFRWSHFGVVGDYQQVLKGFNEEIRKSKSAV